MIYLISVNNRIDKFTEVITKLLAAGFVFSSDRITTVVGSIDRTFRGFSKDDADDYLKEGLMPYHYVTIGERKDEDLRCKMVVHNSAVKVGGDIECTVDYFLTKVFPTW